MRGGGQAMRESKGGKTWQTGHLRVQLSGVQSPVPDCLSSGWWPPFLMHVARVRVIGLTGQVRM